MPSPFPFVRAYITIAIMLSPPALLAQAPANSPLLGQWRFETAIGTSSSNGVVTDDIGQGILSISRAGDGLGATIAWLDERGKITSVRQANGHAEGGGAVFSHPGKRVVSGRAGTDIVSEVTIRWALHAQGGQLAGTRLVETDEDEPKAVTGMRVDAADMVPASALVPAESGDTTAALARGPSTAQERQRVVRLAAEAQHYPLQALQRDGAWLKTWVEEIPDLSLDYGNGYHWLRQAAPASMREALQFQYMASAMAFQIGHADQTAQQPDVDHAAMEGVLRAYGTLLRDGTRPASARLNRALAAQRKGELASFLASLSGRDPLPSGSTAPRTLAQDDAVVRRIVQLSTNEPRAMDWLDILANRFGGRLTGSDAYTHAAAWASAQLQQWGLQSRLEEAGQMPLGFNRGGSSARVVSPVEQTLRIATPAYTAGTRGVQQGLVAIGPATLEEARSRAAQFKDKWVLVGGISSGSGRDGEYSHKPRAITTALLQAGALGTIQAGEEPLYSGAAAPTSWQALPTLPDIKLATAQYAAIREQVKAGVAVTLEFDIRNWFYPGPVAYHNVVAVLPGTAQPEEIVLLGAHLDSFDGASGAADNGTGVATMLEAMRLLSVAGARPRRTIMLVAFGAEENGLKGASAFARQHANQLPQVVMMLNRDTRPGAISSLTIPSAWQPVLKRVELALRGAHPFFEFEATVDDTPRARGAPSGRAGSDDAVFINAGVPAPRFSALTDFDYAVVHHTVADTFDKVLPFRSAQQYSAMSIAVIAYEVANAREPITRDGYYQSAAGR